MHFQVEKCERMFEAQGGFSNALNWSSAQKSHIALKFTRYTTALLSREKAEHAIDGGGDVDENKVVLHAARLVP